MAIDKKLIDQLLTNYKKPEDIIGENGLLKELTKAILERALAVEMTDHLGYEKHDPAGHHRGNTRNGKSAKTLKGDFGELELETPRDRQATFEPKIVAKGQTRWTGFDDKIISMYARGMTTREIQGHLEEMYGIDVSPALISNVTDGVIEEVKLWQGRPLEELYPIVYLDALMVKVRDEGHVQNKAIYVVLGVNLEGQKEVLGLWVAQTEGAKFWLQVLTELQNRGVKDILIACVDGLKGFPEAIEAVYSRKGTLGFLGSLTMPSDCNPSRYLAKTSPRYFTVPSSIRSVDPAICGVTKIRGSVSSGFPSLTGSSFTTSNPAP
jgi:putative transposase